MKIFPGFLLVITCIILFGFNNINPAVNLNITAGLKSPECLGEKFSKFKIRRPDGTQFSNSNFKNKIVFVTFWQKSSPFCREELDAFNEMFEKLKDSSNFIFALFSPDSDSAINEIVATKKVKYNFLHMSADECFRISHGFGFPSSFIVDKRGKIVYYIPSRIITDKEISKTTVMDEYYPNIMKLL